MAGSKKCARLFVTFSALLSGLFSILSFGGTNPEHSFNSHRASTNQALTFRDRVKYQVALEKVYWRHREWPATTGSKPDLNGVMPAVQVESKVSAYLEASRDLEKSGNGLTPGQLQEELDRMARETRRPDMLRELWAALGNDPEVIAECLARPALIARIGTTSSSKTTFHPSRPNDFGSELLPTGLNRILQPPTVTPKRFEYRLAGIASQASSCSDNTWTLTNSSGAPSQRYGHCAVWDGSEMIVWGGYNNGAYFNDGARYDPATDTWFPISAVNAPSPRRYHAAVWSGFELLVWGGSSPNNLFTGNGGRYNPMTDSWTTMSDLNAPSGRYAHSGLWTGSEMIIWGGTDGSSLLNTGGRYNPVADTWHKTTTSGAPEGRRYHSVVWTGSEMIVWGGEGSTQLNTGGRYNPQSDSWTATATQNAPAPRDSHTAVYTGSEMIVWGGSNQVYPYYMNTGGRYSPSSNSWSVLDSANAPSPRSDHSAVWTGSEMILWGGAYLSGTLNTGGRYSPSTNSWRPTTTSNAPSGRYFHSAVWTGNEMIIFGAGLSGGRYCAAQSTAQCSYSVSPATLNFAASGGPGSTNVITSSGCGWTAVSNTSWITISSGSSGSGNGSVSFSVAANTTSNSRSGTLTVAGKTVSISESAASNTCNYSIAPGSIVVKARGVSSTVSVSAAAGCTWSATSDSNWITISSGANGSGNGTVGYTVARNTSASVRRGSIMIADQVFSIKQRGN